MISRKRAFTTWVNFKMERTGIEVGRLLYYCLNSCKYIFVNRHLKSEHPNAKVLTIVTALTLTLP